MRPHRRVQPGCRQLRDIDSEIDDINLDRALGQGERAAIDRPEAVATVEERRLARLRRHVQNDLLVIGVMTGTQRQQLRADALTLQVRMDIEHRQKERRRPVLGDGEAAIAGEPDHASADLGNEMMPGALRVLAPGADFLGVVQDGGPEVGGMPRIGRHIGRGMNRSHGLGIGRVGDADCQLRRQTPPRFGRRWGFPAQLQTEAPEKKTKTETTN
jgi:hypothetical protein